MTGRTLSLRELLAAVPGARLVGDGATPVTQVSADSRAAAPGVLFVAVRGTRVDGHRFAAQAASQGAAVVVEDEAALPEGASGAVVGDSAQALALLASRMAGDPEKAIPLVGVTGTNGKTTVTFILEAILAAAGYSPVMLGTVIFRHGAWEIPATHTTPDPLALARILAERVAAGATHGVLEVSSHALAQRRADGLSFDVGVFTNLSREHLEYHRDLEDYFQAKARLFWELLPWWGKGPRAAVVWGEDPWGQRILASAEGLRCLSFGLDPEGGFSVHPRRSRLSLGGIDAAVVTPAGEVALRSSLVGEHNLLNLLAAVGAAVALEIPLAAISAGVEALKAVPGRLEAVGDGDPVRVFVDYAHSPDALSHVASELRRLGGGGRLITVFGCAGDRDPGKRPLMAQAAFAASDAVVITSDNPRSEDPAAIIEEVIAGLPPGARFAESPAALEEGSYARVVDRAPAIHQAIAAARPGDTVLIAGKGHETYQIVGDERRDFDDRAVARAALAGRR